MQHLLTTLADALWPPSEHAKQLRKVSPAMADSYYAPGVQAGVHYLANYKEPLIQAAIQEHKFYYNRRATAFLSALLKHWHDTQTVDTLYIPVPLSTKRQRVRGYNQVTELLRFSQLPFQTHLLRRSRHTPPQTSLSRQARTHNLTGAFAINQAQISDITAQQLVLLDDVVTTGATVTAAQATLTPHLPPHTSLTLLALAH